MWNETTRLAFHRYRACPSGIVTMANKLLAISRLKPGEVKSFQIPFALRHFAAGCDIDKPVGTYCALYPTPKGFQAEVQQFSNSPSGCQQALAWVLSHAEKHLPPDQKPLFIIESTGCYHQLPVKTFNDATEVIVVNPHRIKAILHADGKDDVKDAVTLTKLVWSFDLKKSVLAVGAQKRLRKGLRMKRKLIDNRTQVSNRIGSLLTEHSLPLPNVVKVMTISGRAICKAIAQGQANRDLLMLLWQGKNLPASGLELLAQGQPFLQVLAGFAPTMKNKDVERLKEIYDALFYVADLEHSIRNLLGQQLRLLEVYDQEIALIEQEVVMAIDAYKIELPGGGQRTAQDMIDLIRTAPVFSEESARMLVAEAGLNFPEIYGDADAFARNFGLTPGHSKSAGKVVGNDMVKGNQYYKPVIVQAATVFLRRQLEQEDNGWFLWLWGRRYQQRSDAQHARIAVARKITRSVYFMCRHWQPYNDNQHRRLREDYALQTAKRLANTAKELSAASRDIVGLDAAAKLKQASFAINQALGLQVSRYKLCPFDHDFPVDTLDLSTRVVNLLLKNDIISVSQLVLRLVSGTLISVKGLGVKAAQEIEDVLVSKSFVEVQASDPV
jgi:transposase